MVSPVLVQSVVLSSIIALLGIGLTLTYMTTRVPNFAHGGTATVGMYVGLTAVEVWNGNPYVYSPASFLLGGFTGLGLYFLVLKPLIRREASFVSLMIATIGFDFCVFSIISIYADYLLRIYQITSSFFILSDADFRLGEIGAIKFDSPLPGILLVAPLLVVSLTVFLHELLHRTRFGVSMRATVENPSLAGVVGVNVNLVYAVSWFVSGGLAGLAGLLSVLVISGSPQTGNELLPSIFAASITGGLGSIYGTILGAFIIGISSVLGTSYLASTVSASAFAYRPIIPVFFMVISLLLAPKGITAIDWASTVRYVRAKLFGHPR